MNNLPLINPEEEIKKITNFIKDTLAKQSKEKIVLGLSGGVDSTTSLYLAVKAIGPKNVYAINLPYFDDKSRDIDEVVRKVKLSADRVMVISIKPIVDETIKILNIPKDDTVRRGNVMARARMIILYDLAKRFDALVCGTENRSEKLLGYYTRFGDEAADFEPLLHLYKAQVYEIAKCLSLPQSVMDKPPSANLWVDQTDEGEFGFSYKEADPVLYLYFDEKKPLEEIEKIGFPNASKIIEFAKKNSYKHDTPYKL